MQPFGEQSATNEDETTRPTPMRSTPLSTTRPRAGSHAHFSRELSRSPAFGTQHGYDGKIRSGGARQRGGGRERTRELSRRKHKKSRVYPVVAGLAAPLADVSASASSSSNQRNGRKRRCGNERDIRATSYFENSNTESRVAGGKSSGGGARGRSLDRSSQRAHTSGNNRRRNNWRCREDKRNRGRSLSNNHMRTIDMNEQRGPSYSRQQRSMRSVSVSWKDTKRGNRRDDGRERGRKSNYSTTSFRPHQSQSRRRYYSRSPSPRRYVRNNSRGHSSRHNSPRRSDRAVSRYSKRERSPRPSSSSRHDGHRFRSLGRQGTPTTGSIAGSSMASSRRSSRDRDQAQRHRSRFASRSPSCSAYSGSGSDGWSNDEKEFEDEEDEGEVVTISGRAKLYPDEASRVGLAHGILELEYWDRTDECHQRKRKHLDSLDDSNETREETIFRTTLKDVDVAVEPNMFAYETPEDVLHYTFWSRKDATNEEVERAVENWIQKEKPEVIEWDFDLSNLEDGLSIEIYHVHVFFRVRTSGGTSLSCEPEEGVVPNRNAEDLTGVVL